MQKQEGTLPCDCGGAVKLSVQSRRVEADGRVIMVYEISPHQTLKCSKCGLELVLFQGCAVSALVRQK